MSMTPEDLQALSEARGRPRTAPARDFTAEIAAAYAPKEAAYGLSTPQAVNPNLVTEASGLYGDTATSQYIRDLQAGVNVGAGTVEQRNAALNILIEQGKRAQTAAATAAANVPRITSSATSVVPSDSNETATTILTNTLKFYGLNEPELINEIRAALANRTITGASSVDEIGIQLRESPAFQRRFAANEARRAAGKPVYSVTQTLLLESQYRKNLRDSGMPAGFYDDPTSLQNFLINDISPDEILSRVTQGYQAVRNADPTVINELKTLYNLDDGSIAAFFVDPAKAQDNILRAARAAEIGAQARKQAGIGLTAQTAEELVRQGVTESEAQTGFTTFKQQESLYRPLMGEEEITQEEAIAGTLGTSAEAAQRVGTRKRRRKGTFEAGGRVSLQTIE
jgi:hypothetical protein